MKKKRLAVVIGLFAVLIAGVIGVLFWANNSSGVRFKGNLPEKFTVNQTVNVARYVENSTEEVLVLTAEYEKEGKVSQYQVSNLTFKPLYEGKVKLSVATEEGKNPIDVEVEVVDNAPVVISTTPPTFLVEETIELDILKECIEWESQSEPEITVEKVECSKGIVDLKNETSFTFDTVETYIFFLKLVNSGGSVITKLEVEVEIEPTIKEIHDFTNQVRLGTNSYASILLSQDEHAQNSDWAWAVKASPSADMNSAQYASNRVEIDFGRTMDPETEYFSIEFKTTKDVGEVLIRCKTDEGQVVWSGWHSGTNGEWKKVTSEKNYDNVKITGVTIIVFHPREEKLTEPYDANNVVAIIDNCHINAREGYFATKNAEVSATSESGKNDIGVYGGSVRRVAYLKMNGNYTNEGFTFTTTMSKNGFWIGARLDQVANSVTDSHGIVMYVRTNRIDYYAPNYADAQHKGVFRFKDYGMSDLGVGKEYTFTVWVTEGSKAGTNNLILRIENGDKVIALFEHETCADIRNDDITTGVPKKGCFAVWSMDPSREIEWQIPKVMEIPSTVNKVVPQTDKAGGSANLSSVVAGSSRLASYLHMQGEYGNEGFTFKTKVTKSGFYAGARLDKVTEDVCDSNGIILYIEYNRITYYAPNKGERAVDQGRTGIFRYSRYGVSNLELDKEYTFTIWVTEGSESGTNNLVIRIQDGDTVLAVLNHEECQDIMDTGNITSCVRSTGSFAVWNLDSSREITYSAPVQAMTENKVVESTETEGGTASLSNAIPGTKTKASYLHMKGAYTNEGFTFKTTIGSGFYVGARLDKVTQNVGSSTGIILKVGIDQIDYYASSMADVQQRGYFVYGDYASNLTKLQSDKEYTFTIAVTEGNKENTNNLLVRIQDGTQTVLVFEHESCINIMNAGDIATNVPESGAFAIWNTDASREIEYQIPKTVDTKMTLAPKTTGAADKSALLTVAGGYTDEGFEFTTHLTSTTEWLFAGARLQACTIGENLYDARGIIIRIRYDKLYFDSPRFNSGEIYREGTFVFRDNGLSNLTVNKDYTFTVWVTDGSVAGTYNVVVQIKDGDTIHSLINFETMAAKLTGASQGGGTFKATDVPASGAFAVWSSQQRQLSWAITSDKVKVTLTPETEGDITKTAFLSAAGTYTNEKIEFTTQLKDTDEWLYAGARLEPDTIGANLYDARGIIVRIKHDTIYFDSPRFDSNGTYREGYVNFAEKGLDVLAIGKDYTFTIWVTAGSVADTYNVVVQIKDGDTVHSTIDFETMATKDTEKGGGTFATADVQASGAFAVWSTKERQLSWTITGRPPVQGETVSGTAVKLSPETEGDIVKSDYFTVAGDYTNEGFEFTTQLKSTTEWLFAGARLKTGTIGENLYDARGVIIRIRYDKLYFDSPRFNSGEIYREGSYVFKDNGLSALEIGKDYTFTLWVTNGSVADTYNVVVQIKDGDTIHSTINFETMATKLTGANQGGGTIKTTDVQASGAFAVWSTKARKVYYSVLDASTVPTAQ